jgi:hypothetical protein
LISVLPRSASDLFHSQEVQYIHDKVDVLLFFCIFASNRYQEQKQLNAIRDSLDKDANETVKEDSAVQKDRDFEGGFGGQEDLEDRYATTSGEH